MVNVTVVGHRGDAFRYRENTIPSFRSAVAGGADRVELDVRTTRDGVCVVLHDLTLLRLWGVAAHVASLDWEDVAQLGYADVRVPRLRDVLDELADSGVGVLIDVTCVGDAEAAYAVVASFATGANRAPSPEVHWCGAHDAMRRIRELDAGAVIYLATETGHADPELVRDLAPAYLNLDGTVLAPEVIAAAHDLGLKVSVWTIDDAFAMRALLAMGPDSMTTNRPSLLREVLADLDSSAPEPPALDSSDENSRSLAVASALGSWAASYLAEARPGTVETKAHAADLVTDVDRDVEIRVREVLAATLPDHVIVGEEQGGVTVAGVPCWYLDPIDGTTNFAHGIGWSSFSLAMAVDQDPRVAVVADPFRAEVLEAVVGGGAWCAGRRLRVSDATSVTGHVVMTEWASHVPWPGMLDMMAALGGVSATPRIMGSGALALSMVATGRAVGAVLGAFSPIDHLAGLLLAVEAGAVILDGQGRRTTWPLPSDRPFLAAAPGCADALNGMLQEALRPISRP